MPTLRELPPPPTNAPTTTPRHSIRERMEELLVALQELNRHATGEPPPRPTLTVVKGDKDDA